MRTALCLPRLAPRRTRPMQLTAQALAVSVMQALEATDDLLVDLQDRAC